MHKVWEPIAASRGTVVLLHGAMAAASTWWRIGPALAGHGWQVHAVDLPGHGSAARFTGRFTMDRFAALTADRLPDRIDLLVGHSLGAVVGLLVAARRLRPVSALVLEDPPDEAPAAGIPAPVDRDAALRRVRTSNPAWTEQDVVHAVDSAFAVDSDGFTAALATQPQWDLADLVASAGLPTVVLTPPTGTGGALSAARPALRALVGPQRFVELDGGHCAHRACPELWLAAVTAFADQVLPVSDSGHA
ncbi:alpha/beta fold hydrolase [Dactylosporangium sp. NPDC051541]|uniref:alpha/beta fold hydrolase n=1 Tax=Dactylosporangium sp. NPDC051541 TaxID=3363977 RepID=UPI0037B8B977